MRVAQNSIRVNGHELFNIKQNKVALSAIDDKRYVLSHGRTRFVSKFHAQITCYIVVLKVFQKIIKK